jgi:hypothetical protein
LAKVGFSEATGKGSTWLDKLLLDIEDIQPNSTGQPVPINYIIFLKNPEFVDQDSSDRDERELDVLVERLDVIVLASIKKMPTVTKLQIDQERGYPLLKLRTSNRTAVLSQIEALCQEHQILILDVIKRKYGRPTFDRPAELKAIPNSQATIELLKQFQGGHKSLLLQQEFGGSSTRLFMDLMNIISQTKCYQLQVGELDQMTELVSELVSVG